MATASVVVHFREGRIRLSDGGFDSAPLAVIILVPRLRDLQDQLEQKASCTAVIGLILDAGRC